MGWVAFLVLVSLTAQRAVADSTDPCPFGGGPGAISRCTQTLQSPRLLPADKLYALWARGWANYNASQYVAALSDFDAAIALIPNDTTYPGQGLHPPGSAERERSDQDGDLLYPFGDFYVGRATMLMWLARFDEAIGAAGKAETTFRSQQRKADARALQAEINLRMGDAVEAERLYRQAADLDTTSYEPLYDMALLKLSKGESHGIGVILEEAIGRDPISRKPTVLLVALNLSSPERKEELLPRNEHREYDWDDAIVEYFAGRIDLAALMKRPEGTDVSADGYRLCNIHFFLGVAAISIDKAAAIGHFESAIATGADHSVEYFASQLMLTKLSGN